MAAQRKRRKPLITFEGWDGQWWKRIKVGRAMVDAAVIVYVPWKWQIGIAIGEGVISAVREK